MAKTVLKCVKIFFTVILAAVLVCSVYMFIARVFFKNPVPSIFGLAAAKVQTGSMEPEINPGDVVIIKKSKDYKKDDIITFVRDGYAVTHRIDRVSAEGFTTKGDANDSTDTRTVTDGEIVGKVVSVWRNGSAFLDFTGSPGFLILVAGIIIIIYVTPMIAELLTGNKKYKKL